MRKIISVVVPVYNNQPTLEETCRQIMDVHETNFSDLQLEVIFVNDGSTDGSWEELLRLQRIYKDQVSLLNLSRNFGQWSASFAGFNHAKGDAVISVSADLQGPIELMAKMVAYWRSNTDIVICYRESRQDGLFSRVSSNIAYAIARFSYPELPKGGFDYWLMSRRVCDLMCSLKNRNIFMSGFLVSVGFSKTFIPYTRMQRKVGKSGYTFRKKLGIAIEFLITTQIPIRFMSYFGALTALGGLIYSVLIVHAWLVNHTPFSGWAPLMIISMVVGGILMIMLGVIGEYLWRIYDHLRSFPLYIVQAKAGSTERADEEPTGANSAR